MTTDQLPTPHCKYGYTAEQVAHILGQREPEFMEWMRGATMALCDGREFDHQSRRYVPSSCSMAHGGIVYADDLMRFLEGKPNDD